MVDSSFEAEIKKFAHTIHGIVTFKNESHLDHDNVCTIKTLDETIELIWGNQPQRGRGVYVTRQSIFSFKLKADTKTRLRISPKDFLSKMLSVFNSSRTMIGNPHLDKNFLFSTNDIDLLRSLEPELLLFKQFNPFFSFIMEVRDGAEGAMQFVIQSNELIADEKKLTPVYNFGKSVARKMNGKL